MSYAAHSTIGNIGKATQIAYVVRDMNASIRFWTEVMGVGPFFLTEHLPLVNRRYRGRPTDFDMSAAITYWGDLQVELIMQHNDAPSTFKDWYDNPGTGIHHMGVTVDSLEDAVAALERAGGKVVHEHELPGAAAAAYIELPQIGPVMEVVMMDSSLHAAFAKIREVAGRWDGSDPVRRSLP
jgi:methylmalonyl-CoA/ethylmalonyl-CoA epimerase